MKRQSMMKLLMLMVVVMIFMALKADVVEPHPHILSHAEWKKKMSLIVSPETGSLEISTELIIVGVMILITCVATIVSTGRKNGV